MSDWSDDWRAISTKPGTGSEFTVDGIRQAAEKMKQVVAPKQAIVCTPAWWERLKQECPILSEPGPIAHLQTGSLFGIPLYLEKDDEAVQKAAHQLAALGYEVTCYLDENHPAAPEPLKDAVALVLLASFLSQPYEPAHLGVLRDRLDELDRPYLLSALAKFDESWQNQMCQAKRTLKRSRFRRMVQRLRKEVNDLMRTPHTLS